MLKALPCQLGACQYMSLHCQPLSSSITLPFPKQHLPFPSDSLHPDSFQHGSCFPSGSHHVVSTLFIGTYLLSLSTGVKLLSFVSIKHFDSPWGKVLERCACSLQLVNNYSCVKCSLTLQIFAQRPLGSMTQLEAKRTPRGRTALLAVLNPLNSTLWGPHCTWSSNPEELLMYLPIKTQPHPFLLLLCHHPWGCRW